MTSQPNADIQSEFGYNLGGLPSIHLGGEAESQDYQMPRSTCRSRIKSHGVILFAYAWLLRGPATAPLKRRKPTLDQHRRITRTGFALHDLDGCSDIIRTFEKFKILLWGKLGMIGRNCSCQSYLSLPSGTKTKCYDEAISISI